MYLIQLANRQTKKYNPRWGTNEYNENEQGGEQMPNPVCCDAREQENRSEVLQDALRAFLEQREPPRNPATEAREQETENEQEEREAPNPFGSTSSSLREMSFCLLRLPFL